MFKTEIEVFIAEFKAKSGFTIIFFVRTKAVLREALISEARSPVAEARISKVAKARIFSF